ncbi:MAG TPA: type II CAAX endopeptidase family protein [Pseudogracilibacillus sp.]|nr:type II CAAX endopeptidase family protein [Pseudogracilibacillus sp.]
MQSLFRNRSFLVILTYILMQLSTGIVTAFLLMFTSLDQYDAIIYPNIVSFSVGLIIIYLILKEDLHNERLENPLAISRIIGWALLGMIIAYFSQGIAGAIEMYVLDIQPGSENTEVIVGLLEKNIIFLLLPAILGPIIEELVFRKVIFGALRKRMNLHLATVIGALIFALAHFDFAHTLIYFVMGLVFTFLYVKTKRIIVPILAHMGINSLVVVIQMFVDVEELEQILNELNVILLGGWF